MYFDPISAWFVTLLFDGEIILSEKTKGGSANDYYQKSIAQSNANLNGDIQRIKKKYGVNLAELALQEIERHIQVIRQSFSFQQGNGKIYIDSENIEYIIALCRKCVTKYTEYKHKYADHPESVQEYRTKVEAYQRVIVALNKLKINQETAIKQARIKNEKTREADMIILATVIIFIVILIAIALAI